jgi:hypothetical protein
MQVKEARAKYPEADPRDLAESIYGGEIPEKLRSAAVRSVEAALYHLDRGGVLGGTDRAIPPE